MENEAPQKAKYVLYARKSSESDEKQALSIDSQVKEMLAIAERENIEVIEIRRESHSAKDSGQRSVFNELLADIRSGRFNGILTWAPDRLSRNAGDLGSLVDLMDQKLLLEIRTYGQRFTNSPNEKFLLMILCSQAKLENDNKSVNVKRGLRMRCEMGLRPGPAPTGYLNEKRLDRKCHMVIDPARAPIVRQIFEKVAHEGWSGRKIYHWLKFDMNFRSPTSNKVFTLSNVYRLLQLPFYYGTFEYPAGSGNWYTGKHEPIITRELFDKAREQLMRSEIKNQNNEFAFSRLITCEACNSGVTAQEKFKKLRDGTTARYVYYGCTRSQNRSCTSGYIREEVIISDLLENLDLIEIDSKKIQGKIAEEIERFNKFSKMMGNSDPVKHDKIDIKQYFRYVLKYGNAPEQREAMSLLTSRLQLIDRHIRPLQVVINP